MTLALNLSRHNTSDYPLDALCPLKMRASVTENELGDGEVRVAEAEKNIATHFLLATADVVPSQAKNV